MSLLNKSTLKHSVTDALFISLLLVAGTAHAAATLPTGGTVVAGSGSAAIATSGNTETITQSTGKAIINWSSFDVGANGTVNFVQPSATAVTLNRVTGGTSASQIMGTVNANGILFLVNTNGVVFGKNSQVNVGGLIATTSDINNSDFENGTYAFSPTANGHNAASINTDAAIINNGTITVNQDNSIVALIGHDVENNGIIQAKIQTTDKNGKVTTTKTDATGDTVALGAGDTYSVDLNGDGLINLAVTDPNAKNLIAKNSGTIVANGGNVVMTAATAEDTINSLINMTGIIQADNVSAQNGKVELVSTGANSVLDVDGTIKARDGNVSIASEQTTLKKNTVIKAKNGLISVTGGKTAIQNGAQLKARNGFVETSGTNSLQIDAAADIVAGIWLIDPGNAIIANSNPLPFISATAIGNSLDNGSDVIVQANGTGMNGNITVEDSITKTAGGDATLTLSATNNIILDSNVVISSDKNKLSVDLIGDSDNQGGGAVTVNAGSGIASNGGDITITGTTGVHSSSPTGAGIYIAGNINSGSGAITLTGSGLSPNGLFGIFMQNGSIASTTGDITLTGLASDTIGTGIYVGGLNHSSAIGGSTEAGNITFITDTISALKTLDVTTTANVTFEPYKPGASIGVAGAAGTLQITKQLLNNVTASSITVGNSVDTGALKAKAYAWDKNVAAPAVSFLNGGNIVINGMQNLGDGTFLAESVNGNIKLGASGGVTSTATGTPIVLADSNGNFINNNPANKALSADNGRWLIYSNAFDTDNFNTLSYWFEQFQSPYATAALSGENGLLFKSSLLINVGLTGTVEKTYDGTDDATLAANNLTVTNPLYTASITATGASYASPDPGSGIAVTADGIGISDVTTKGGTVVYNYTLNNMTATANVGIINPVPPVVTPTFQSLAQGTPSTSTALNLFSILQKINPPIVRSRGSNGVLLALATNPGGSLGNLAPAAGGNAPIDFDNFSPAQLANLNPSAGGGTTPNGPAGLVALIECNSDTPCQINQ